MARNTTRDEIWTLALIKTLMQGRSIRVPELAEQTGATERTVKDTLNTMAETPFLRRKVDSSTREARYLPPEDPDFSQE